MMFPEYRDDILDDMIFSARDKALDIFLAGETDEEHRFFLSALEKERADRTEAEIKWFKSTINEKAEWVKKANLLGLVVIFTDIEQSPKWNQIDIESQAKLREVMFL